jgi:hypothetical protein
MIIFALEHALGGDTRVIVVLFDDVGYKTLSLDLVVDSQLLESA